MLQITENCDDMKSSRDFHKYENDYIKGILSDKQFKEFFGHEKP